MNDLRHDPADPTDAHAPDLRERTRLNPRDLTTVLMPEPRASHTVGVRFVSLDSLATEMAALRAELAAHSEAIERIANAVTTLQLGFDLARVWRGDENKSAAAVGAVAPEPDWSKAPRWCCWWAVNEDGTAGWFGPQPLPGKQGWYVDIDPRYMVVTSVSAGTVDLNVHDWRQTLRCKPGFIP